MARRSDRMDTLVSLSKRRGFVYPSSEIYGGLRAAWDYGPLGVEMKENIKRLWWRSMVHERDDIVGLDSSVILAPEVWQASGHITEFVDPLTECQSCHRRFRADHLIEAYEEKRGHPPRTAWPTSPARTAGPGARSPSPGCSTACCGPTSAPTEDESGLAYLRPETAQGIFINYKNVLQTSRKKVPFGIGQIGKSFRNEITPGNFIFRTREFEQMEMEFFVQPGTDEDWHERWIDTRLAWYTDLGLRQGQPAAVRAPEGEAVALLQAHRRHRVPLRLRGGEWGELEGIANRTDYDLSTHAKASGQDLSYLDAESGRAIRPVRDRAGGRRRPRACWRSCSTRYTEDEAPDAKGKLEKRTVLRLDPRLAPVKVAVLPLSRQRRPVAEGPGGRRAAAQALEHRLRRRRRDRPPVPPPGRDRHAVLRHRRLRHAGGPGRDGPRARLDEAGAGRPRRAGSLPGATAAWLLTVLLRTCSRTGTQ